jgi:ABC-2 type transport system permease protein
MAAAEQRRSGPMPPAAVDPSVLYEPVRYARIYWAFVKNCLTRELEYRGHFFFLAISNVAWVTLSLALMLFVFGNVRSIGDWDRERIVVLVGTYQLVVSVVFLLFDTNMQRLSELVNRGELDFVLVKPLSSQFMVSTRYVTFNQLPAAVVSAGYVGYGVSQLGEPPGPLAVASYLVLVVSAVVAFYALWFMSVTLTLWSGRINNIAFLIQPVMEMARVPADVFAGLFRPLFTFVIPIALIATVPTKALLGRLEPALAAYALAMAVGLAALSNRWWRFSLRRYASASS